MVESTKVLCPLFDEIEILILCHSLSIFPSLDKIWNSSDSVCFFTLSSLLVFFVNVYLQCDHRAHGLTGWPIVCQQPSLNLVSAEPFSHGTGTLRCLQKEMTTYRHWSVSLWRDPDDVPHCRILSHDKTEWRLISATLCGWRRCFVADQLWLMTSIRKEHGLTGWPVVCQHPSLLFNLNEDFIEAVHQTLMCKGVMSIPLFQEGFKSSHWRNSYRPRLLLDEKVT